MRGLIYLYVQTQLNEASYDARPNIRVAQARVERSVYDARPLHSLLKNLENGKNGFLVHEYGRLPFNYTERENIASKLTPSEG